MVSLWFSMMHMPYNGIVKRELHDNTLFGVFGSGDQGEQIFDTAA
jgi:hypothetical protein